MIPPTVGRVVWFRPDPRESLVGNDGLAALIAYVWSDTEVNLAVFDANGSSHSRTSIELIQDPQQLENLTGSYCEWMPYQKGQAAKTEALERKA